MSSRSNPPPAPVLFSRAGRPDLWSRNCVPVSGTIMTLPHRHTACAVSPFCLSMISAQTLRVCRGGKPVSTFPDHALSLRPRQIHLALGAEHIAVQIGDPLAAAGGHVEITDRKLDLRRHVGPVELRELVDDVGRRLVAERLVQSDLLELVEQ